MLLLLLLLLSISRRARRRGARLALQAMPTVGSAAMSLKEVLCTCVVVEGGLWE